MLLNSTKPNTVEGWSRRERVIARVAEISRLSTSRIEVLLWVSDELNHPDWQAMIAAFDQVLAEQEASLATPLS